MKYLGVLSNILTTIEIKMVKKEHYLHETETQKITKKFLLETSQTWWKYYNSIAEKLQTALRGGKLDLSEKEIGTLMSLCGEKYLQARSDELFFKDNSWKNISEFWGLDK